MNDNPAHYNLYDYNTRKLRQLGQERDRAQARLDAAQAVAAGLTVRQANYRSAALKAHAAAAQAAGAYGAGRAATQAAEQVTGPANDAAAQARTIHEAVDPLLRHARETAEKMIFAMAAIDKLVACVADRQGKNDVTPALMVTRTAQAKASATNALNAINMAVQQTITAVIAAAEARNVADAVPGAARRLSEILLRTKAAAIAMPPPGAAPATPESRATVTLQSLAYDVIHNGPSVLEVLASASQLAQTIAEMEQAAATQATLQLDSANAEVNAATTESKRSQAAYAAAEAAVA